MNHALSEKLLTLEGSPVTLYLKRLRFGERMVLRLSWLMYTPLLIL